MFVARTLTEIFAGFISPLCKEKYKQTKKIKIRQLQQCIVKMKNYDYFAVNRNMSSNNCRNQKLKKTGITQNIQKRLIF